MEWLSNFIKNNPILAISVPTIFSGFNFFGNLMLALSDGILTETEFHQLASSANGAEMFLLVIIMFALRIKK